MYSTVHIGGARISRESVREPTEATQGPNPWTGAPCSPQRTWAGYDLFRMLLLHLRRSNRWDESFGRASPRFPVKLDGVGELHAAFLTESRTRGPVQCSVQEIGGRHLFEPMYAEANMGQPVQGLGPCVASVGSHTDSDVLGTLDREIKAHTQKRRTSLNLPLQRRTESE